MAEARKRARIAGPVRALWSTWANSRRTCRSPHAHIVSHVIGLCSDSGAATKSSKNLFPVFTHEKTEIRDRGGIEGQGYNRPVRAAQRSQSEALRVSGTPHPSTRGHCFSFFCRVNRDLRIGKFTQPIFWQCHFDFRANLIFNNWRLDKDTDIYLWYGFH